MYCLTCKAIDVDTVDWLCADCARRKKKSTRLAGHSLLREGRPYHVSPCKECVPGGPDLAYGGFVAKGYGGHGRCICGDASPCLDSDAARKRWHAEHKDQVRALQQ